MAKILVIIPSYNEKDTVIVLIEKLFHLKLDLDVLVVDDSKDETGDLIKKKQLERANLYLIKRQGKLGRGTAVLDGLKFGFNKDYQYFVEMDADLSHQPDELPSLMSLAAPNQVVIGSRYLKESKIVNWPFKRRIFSRLANFYAGLILGIGIHDYTNGFRVYGREAALKINFGEIKSTGYIVLSEIAYQLFKKGVEFVEQKTIFINRSRGRSNFSFKEIKESFLSVLRIKRNFK